MGKWCYTSGTSVFHTLEPYYTVNSLALEFCPWLVGSIDLRGVLVLDPCEKTTIGLSKFMK